MIRKYHNHKLQTTPWHREEEPLNHHKTPGRQIKQSNMSIFPPLPLYVNHVLVYDYLEEKKSRYGNLEILPSLQEYH